MSAPSHGVEIISGNTTLILINVDNLYVGLSVTESGPRPFEMRRCGLEIKDVEALKQMREFLDQQIRRMS